jgi:hypothetical protein
MEKVGSAAAAAAGSETAGHAEAGVARSAERTSVAPKNLKLVMLSSYWRATPARGALVLDMTDS